MNIADAIAFLSPTHIGEFPASPVGFAEAQEAAVKEILRSWLSNPLFRARVSAIVVEEARGLAVAAHYQKVAELLKSEIDAKGCDILMLVHARGRDGDAKAQAAFQSGADGIWGAFLSGVAQQGHSCSSAFLDSLLSDSRIRPALTSQDFISPVGPAGQIMHSFNFQAVDIPQDASLFGTRVIRLVPDSFETRGWERRLFSCDPSWQNGDPMESFKLAKVAQGRRRPGAEPQRCIFGCGTATRARSRCCFLRAARTRTRRAIAGGQPFIWHR